MVYSNLHMSLNAHLRRLEQKAELLQDPRSDYHTSVEMWSVSPPDKEVQMQVPEGEKSRLYYFSVKEKRIKRLEWLQKLHMYLLQFRSHLIRVSVECYLLSLMPSARSVYILQTNQLCNTIYATTKNTRTNLGNTVNLICSTAFKCDLNTSGHFEE